MRRGMVSLLEVLVPRGADVSRPWKRVWRVSLFGALALSAAPRPASADANALWHIVSEQCVADQKQNHSPVPCAEVNLAGGYAVLKDLIGNTQFLLIPTTRMSGIESADVLSPSAPNYWADAWQARSFVEDRVRRHLPRDMIGLAINSISGRTQNQLHIHIDCIRLDVHAALREHAAAIGTHWSRFPVPLVGHDYMAMRVEQAELGAINPFVLLADGVAGARSDMAHETLVVIGDSFQGKDGFVLLAGHATPATGNWGAGEQLLDHACAAATVAAQ
ncbi:MAG TPA: CDP-diacylglycerol diphosphatase [Acetobacteraceae bacterium]|jgi:CDP-diacylglycerol pyrophosphatase|nr:CDP-diacylglycerol diphosphatase [Acetobacteraceae bacterium]